MEVFGTHRERTPLDVFTDIVAAITTFVTTVIALIFGFAFALVAGALALWVCIEADFGNLATLGAVAMAFISTAAATLIPPHHAKGLLDAEQLNDAALHEMSLDKNERAVMSTTTKTLRSLGTGIYDCIAPCCTPCDWLGKQMAKLLTPTIVQAIMVITALLQFAALSLEPPSKPMAALVSFTIATIQLIDVFATLPSAFESCGCILPARCITAANRIFGDTLQLLCEKVAAIVGEITHCVLQCAMSCVPTPPKEEHFSLDKLNDSLRTKLKQSMHHGGNTPACLAWLSVPIKYLYAILQALGTTVRHSPIKWAAVSASLVVLIEDLRVLWSDLMETAMMAGIVAAPPPPALHAQIFRIVPALFEEGVDPVTHAFLEWVKPTLALLAAASIMAATTDTVRSVLRPEEYALQRRLEGMWRDSVDAVNERTAAMVDTVIGSRLKLSAAMDAAGKVAAAGARKASKVVEDTASVVEHSVTHSVEHVEHAASFVVHLGGSAVAAGTAAAHAAATKLQAAERGRKGRSKKKGLWAA